MAQNIFIYFNSVISLESDRNAGPIPIRVAGERLLIQKKLLFFFSLPVRRNVASRGGSTLNKGYSVTKYPLFLVKNFIHIVFLKYMKKIKNNTHSSIAGPK
jgi:hypothetical protein